MEAKKIQNLPYRDNVCCIVFKGKRFLLVQNLGFKDNWWKFPQGGIEKNETVGIGNDFNDVDLLEMTHESYVVANAPDELKQRFNVVGSNEKNGFAEVVKRIVSNEQKRTL